MSGAQQTRGHDVRAAAVGEMVPAHRTPAAASIGPSADTQVQPAVFQQGTVPKNDPSSSLIRKAGATAPANRAGAPEVEWTPAMDRKLRDGYPLGKPHLLADDIGVAQATMYKRLRVLGIPMRGNWRAVSADTTQQMRKARAEGMSIRAIASKYGVGRHTVVRHTEGAGE